MKDIFRFHIHGLLAILVLLSSLISAGCNKEDLYRIFSKKPTNMGRLYDTYLDYLDHVSSPELPLHSLRRNAGFCNHAEYFNNIQIDHDLLYFPGTIWQVYSLKGSSRWKQYATQFTDLLEFPDSSTYLFNGEVLQNVMLTAYMQTGKETFFNSVIKNLSGYLYQMEQNGTISNCEDINGRKAIDCLLENPVFFYASKATGDPVFVKYALTKSNYMYNEYFENIHSGYFLLGLADTPLIMPDMATLRKLSSDDIYNLAVSIYGCSILYKETGIEKYRILSQNIASVFINMFDYANSEGLKDGFWFPADNMDLLSKALVCLAMIEMDEVQANRYKENSSRIFTHILDMLELCAHQDSRLNDKGQVSLCSFRLYYYLFEYIKRTKKE